jgi:hypothetical protein
MNKEDAMIQIICTVAAATLSPVIIVLLEYIFKDRRERRRRAEEERRQAEELFEFKLLALQCVITNKELELRTRLDAYDRYKKIGGNSWVDRYVLQHLTENRI